MVSLAPHTTGPWSDMSDFQRGDHVTVGAYGKIHWEVENVWRLPPRSLEEGEQVLIMKSPMSDRRRTELARYVTLYRRAEASNLAAED